MEVDLDEVMGDTDDEMSSQAESARQMLCEKRAALQLAIAEMVETQEEAQAEILAPLEAWKNKTEEQKRKNSFEIQVLRNKWMKMMMDEFKTCARINGSLMDIVDLMEEVNDHDKASLRAQVATLEQERVNQVKEAKREADPLRVQLHEKAKLTESLHRLVAMLEQERDERKEHAKKADSLRLQLQEAMEVDSCRRVQMATLEQQLQKANESRRVQVAQAKEVEDSLRLQLHEQMIKCSSLQSQVAMMKPI